MWVSFQSWKELNAELMVADRLRGEAEKQTAYAEAKLDAQEEAMKKLELEVTTLKAERKELLDELLIASGVKMSKYQEALAQKQLEAEDATPAYTGQTRAWAHQKTQESFMTQEEKNRRAIELVEQLEREAELKNTGGFGNV